MAKRAVRSQLWSTRVEKESIDAIQEFRKRIEDLMVELRTKTNHRVANDCGPNLARGHPRQAATLEKEHPACNQRKRQEIRGRHAGNSKEITRQAGDNLPLTLIHISEPTRRTPISYAVF